MFNTVEKEIEFPQYNGCCFVQLAKDSKKKCCKKYKKKGKSHCKKCPVQA